jgi:hypothetical protein
MQLVYVYALGALLATLAAVWSGPDTPPLVYWLYVAGAVLFALAAAGQYFKINAAR